MRKKCPYCGCENEAEVVKFCQACGREIPENSGFEYDFGGQQQTAPYANVTPAPESNYIPLNIENKKANKMKNNVFGWSIFFIVIGILRFISILTGVDDIEYLQNFLDTNTSISDKIYYAIQDYIMIYYVDIVVTLLLLVMCVLLIVFVAKTKKINFPVSDDSVFGLFKKNFIVSAVLLVCTIVYLVMEVVVVVFTMNAYNAIDAKFTLMQTAMLGGSFAGDILLIVGAIICTVQSKKLANCRR